MPPPQPEPPRRRFFSNGLLVSLVFHIVVIGMLVWFAAREGMLGQPLKQITVRLMPPPEPEKAAEPNKPKPELPKEMPSVEAAPPRAPVPPLIEIPKPVSEATPPAVVPAPAPAEMPSLAFDDGGKTVQTEKDPANLYRSFVEFSLRSRWNRPADIVDQHYVAEIEVAVDASGRISDPVWKHKSGDTRWDASVMEAVQRTPQLGRPPPIGFPLRMTVRFDVVRSAELNVP